jgi:predicted PurR-regulated permease PerM
MGKVILNLFNNNKSRDSGKMAGYVELLLFCHRSRMSYLELQQKTFLLLLALVSVAFIWILWPFFGAIFWGAALAILFRPLYRRVLTGVGMRPNLASAITVLASVVMVILPLAFITASLVTEGTRLFQDISSREIDFSAYFAQIIASLPAWLADMLERNGLTDLSLLQEKFADNFAQGGQMMLTRAFNIGQNTFNFVISFVIMLYLLFFLLRDGNHLAEKIRQALPISMEHQRHLSSKFTTVLRATVKGNIVVAATQGALGGAIFWILGIQGPILWGVVMAFLSLLPAVGAALIWAPVAIYFLVTGALWQGITLIAFGVVVIGLVDNVLRPILVGKDTHLPDYVILISTLGGMALFGLTGFVLGPVIAALFIAVWDLFALEKQSSKA